MFQSIPLSIYSKYSIPFSTAYSGVRSQGQQTQLADPDFPLTRNIFQLFLGDPEAFTGQPEDKIR